MLLVSLTNASKVVGPMTTLAHLSSRRTLRHVRVPTATTVSTFRCVVVLVVVFGVLVGVVVILVVLIVVLFVILIVVVVLILAFL